MNGGNTGLILAGLLFAEPEMYSTSEHFINHFTSSCGQPQKDT